MTNVWGMRIFWGCAAAVFFSGIVLAVKVAGSVPPARDQLTRVGVNLHRLALLESDLARYEAARSLFEALPVKRASALEQLASGVFREAKSPEIQEQETIAVGEWFLKRYEVSFPDAPLAHVLEFASLAEAQRPPWRLVQCEIRASSRTSGTGHVTLVFESLEKSR